MSLGTSAFDSASAAEFLNGEFTRRKHRNQSYSLRAFARDLQLSPSRLSEVLKGDQGLSEKTADTIADQLELKPLERSFWKDLILSESARSPKVRELAAKRVEELRKTEQLRKLREDQFRAIADWYHAAILELVQLADFDSDPEWIARRLGITAPQATAAVNRLLQLGLLVEASDGKSEAETDTDSDTGSGNRSRTGSGPSFRRLVACSEAYSTFSEVPSSAIRKFHRQVLEMHQESLAEDTMHERELLSMIVAVPRSVLPDFRQEMKKFMTEFWQKLEGQAKEELYSLSVQLCPVKNRRRGRKNDPSQSV